MKIAQISATFPPYMAGTGNVCYHYSLELAKRGHEVTVFTSRFPDQDYSYPDSIRVHRFRPLFRIGNAPFLPPLLGLKGYDLVHLHYPFFFGGEMAYANRRLWGQKYVLTYHNDVIAPGLRGSLFDLHGRTLARVVLRNAERIIVLSRDYTEHSRFAAAFAANNDRVRVLQNGVDIAVYNPHNPLPEGLRKDAPVILFVGALDRAHMFKGLELLLRSCAELEAGSYSLVVVGDGELKSYYRDLASSLGLGSAVIFAGRVKAEDLPRYYAAADLLALPSTAVENFPLVTLEAMASGRPVVTSSLPGVRTIIDHGVNGYLVPPNDTRDLAAKIRILLADPALRATMGAEGRKKAEELYAWEKIGARLEGIYREVLE